jgi:hypothetical protein
MSMTSIMSTTGNGKLPQAEKHAMEALIAPITSMEEESLVAHGLNIAKNIGSPGFPFDPEAQRERVLRNVRRSVYPAGPPRQLAAIIDDGCRRSRLASVRTPTLVLHGEDDPLVKLAAGEDTARHISGARLVTMILEDDSLRADWKAELEEVRLNMLSLRQALADALRRATNSDRFDFVATHRGMFSRLGLTEAQVNVLRETHGIYMVGDSRINIAGLNTRTVPILAAAIASVI